MSVYIHLFDDSVRGAEFIATKRYGNCPRVGDEIRLSGDRFYTVKRIVWCFDEGSDGGCDRVNIGAVPADTKAKGRAG